MSNGSLNLTDAELGERLRLAREAAKLTQATAADIIDAARTTIVAVEQGQRRVRMDELQKLAAAYGTSVNALLRREAIHLDLVPRFRKHKQSENGAVEEAVRLLSHLAKAETEFEQALGIEHRRNYPPERPILPGDVKLQAEQDAQDLRDWLGLGPGPVHNIVQILELQLGIRVYCRKLERRISGLFIYDEVIGACMLLNTDLPRERFVMTALHELGHFVSVRHEPDVSIEGQASTSREETYAKFFAICFLMPARAVRQQFAEITAGQSQLTRRHVILLAASFGVSRETLVRRLEELGLAKKGSWDWFEAYGGITQDHVRQVLGEGAEKLAFSADASGPVPPRVALLAREAWKRDFYSEGQLSRMLDIHRLDVREMLEGAEYEDSEADERVKLPA